MITNELFKAMHKTLVLTFTLFCGVLLIALVNGCFDIIDRYTGITVVNNANAIYYDEH